MSYHEYRCSQDIDLRDYPFYSLIMACMRKADSQNLQSLQREFPFTWSELQARHDAPGGILEGDNA